MSDLLGRRAIINSVSEFLLVAKVCIAEYLRKPLLNIGFIFSLAIATSTLLSILILNDASKQQYQAANTRLKSPIAFNIVPKKGEIITIADFARLRALGFSQINASHLFQKTFANGKKINFRALDILPFVLTSPQSFTSEAVNISQSYATKLGLAVTAQHLPKLLFANQKSVPLKVNQFNDWGSVALIDITLAWQLFPDIKGFSHLMVGPISDRALAQLTSVLPQHLTIEQVWSIEEREGFAEALHLNLFALAVLGFIVSLFIAFQAANQAWTKRGELATQLRLLGVELKIIQVVMLSEALLLTLLASIIGAVIAIALVSFLLPMLGVTLEQLYRLQTSGHFQWRGDYSIWAFLISFVAVIAALIKQFFAISADNIAQSARATTTRFSFKKNAVIALSLVVVHICWPNDSWLQLMLKYGLLLVASVALLPMMLSYLFLLLSYIIKPFRIQFILVDAGQQITRRFLPIAAFYLALTASIAAALMVHSFQSSFESYLNQLLSADLFVRFDEQQKPKLAQRLAQNDRIDEYVLFESTLAKYQQDTVEVYRLAADRQQQSLILKSGSLVAFSATKKHCYINEQLAYKRDIALGQKINIAQNQRAFSCQVQGIYYDYGNQGFAIKVPSFHKITELTGWRETGFGIFLVHDSQSNVQIVIDALTLDDELSLTKEQIYQPEQIKGLALAIFKQTFLLTQAIAFVLLSIACFGLFLSANSLELARKADLHILSSLGYSRVEVFAHMLSQWFLIAFATILLSWPMAIVLANALVSLILPASFGWSMPLQLDVTSFSVSSFIGLVLLIPALAIPLYKLNIRASLS